MNRPQNKRRSTGKRGRPESIVRQFWEDIDAPNIGAKCIYCNHRSMTRQFRAPPATRHTLICKNAPEAVKDQLRRATNNKYSRRRPPPGPSASKRRTPATTAMVAPSAHHAIANSASGPAQAQVLHNTQPTHSGIPVTAPHTAGQPNGGPSQPPFSFVKHTAQHTDGGHQEGNGTIGATLAPSPRHLGAPSTVPPMTPTAGMNAGNVETGVVGANVRSSLLTEHARGNAGTPRSMGIAGPSGQPVGPSLSPGTDLLYPNGGAQQRLLAPTAELNTHVDMPKHVALTEAVVESLFQGAGRPRVGAVPTPAEFRAALKEAKEFARMRVKRQRDEARLEICRMQDAITLLVQGKNGQGRQVGAANGAPGHGAADVAETDDSEDEVRGGRNGWVGYDGRK